MKHQRRHPTRAKKVTLPTNLRWVALIIAAFVLGILLGTRLTKDKESIEEELVDHSLAPSVVQLRSLQMLHYKARHNATRLHLLFEVATTCVHCLLPIQCVYMHVKSRPIDPPFQPNGIPTNKSYRRSKETLVVARGPMPLVVMAQRMPMRLPFWSKIIMAKLLRVFWENSTKYNPSSWK